MSMHREPADTPLPPAWMAAAAAVASLLALWPCQSLARDLGSGGIGWFVLAIFVPIVFGVVYMAVFFPLAWLLKRQRSPQARWALCLVPAAVPLAVNGVPGLVGLGWTLLMCAGVYVEAARKIADGRDLRSFLKGRQPIADRPRQLPASGAGLHAYDMPLWTRLGCDNPEPLSTTEGVEDGFRFTVLDLRHTGFGMRGDNGATVVTTFFIVAIPDAIKGRVVSWQPEGWDVSVDAGHLYMARPQTQVRPGEWRGLIQQAIKAVESLQSRDEAGSRAGVRTYRPRGHGVALNMFNAGLFLLVGTAMVGYGLAHMVGVLDYRTGCLRGSTAARCLDTKHGYSVPGALMWGGKFVLAGGFLLWGAHHSRSRARQRQRVEAHQQADV